MSVTQGQQCLPVASGREQIELGNQISYLLSTWSGPVPTTILQWQNSGNDRRCKEEKSPSFTSIYRSFLLFPVLVLHSTLLPLVLFFLCFHFVIGWLLFCLALLFSPSGITHLSSSWRPHLLLLGPLVINSVVLSKDYFLSSAVDEHSTIQTCWKTWLLPLVVYNLSCCQIDNHTELCQCVYWSSVIDTSSTN